MNRITIDDITFWIVIFSMVGSSISLGANFFRDEDIPHTVECSYLDVKYNTFDSFKTTWRNSNE